MYALRDQETLRKLTGIVCLSTPFLNFRTAAFPRDLLAISAAVLWAIAWGHHSMALWAYCVVYTLLVARLLLAHRFGDTEKSALDIAEYLRLVKAPTRERAGGCSTVSSPCASAVS